MWIRVIAALLLLAVVALAGNWALHVLFHAGLVSAVTRGY